MMNKHMAESENEPVEVQNCDLLAFFLDQRSI